MEFISNVFETVCRCWDKCAGYEEPWNYLACILMIIIPLILIEMVWTRIKRIWKVAKEICGRCRELGRYGLFLIIIPIGVVAFVFAIPFLLLDRYFPKSNDEKLSANEVRRCPFDSNRLARHIDGSECLKVSELGSLLRWAEQVSRMQERGVPSDE